MREKIVLACPAGWTPPRRPCCWSGRGTPSPAVIWTSAWAAPGRRTPPPWRTGWASPWSSSHRGGAGAGGVRPLRRRLPLRPHPPALRPMQPAGEVPRPAGPGGPAGGPVRVHRPLRPGGKRPAEEGPPRQRPVLYAGPAHERAITAGDIPPGRLRKDGGPGPGPGSRHPGGGQARLHGDLLRPRRGLRGLAGGAGAFPHRRAILWTSPAASWAATGASTATPWARAGAWGCRGPTAIMWRASARRRTRWSSPTGPTWAGTGCSAGTSTGWPGILPPAPWR